MTHSQVPSAAPDDAADLLAKEAISRMITAANNYVRHRVMQVHITNPLEGMKLPFKPLADRIREVARQMSGVPQPKADGWFDDQQTAAAAPVTPAPHVPRGTIEPPAPQGVGVECEGGGESVGLEAILSALKTKKYRLSNLAEDLGVSRESLAQVIARPTSGLTIAAGGWVQIVE